jgi:hypothetical protein
VTTPQDPLAVAPHSGPVAAARASRWLAAGIGVTLLSLLAFAALQYRMPLGWDTYLGNSPEAARDYQQAILRGPVARLETPVFTWLMRICIVSCWLGYGIAIAAGLRDGALRPRAALLAIAGMGLVMALLCPPSLSLDSYLYIAFARNYVAHGIHPYVHSLEQVRALGDPHAGNLGPSGYGPVWTWICVAIFALLGSLDLWWQLAAVKLLAAASLLVAALAGREIARRLSPSRGDLTLIAIGVNPLFVIEGPGNGHFDMLLMALTLAALCLFMRGRYPAAILLLGVSIAVKYITVALVPWLLLEQLAQKRPLARVRVILATAVLALGPLVAAFAPFWRGPATIAGILTHARWGTKKAVEAGQGPLDFLTRLLRQTGMSAASCQAIAPLIARFGPLLAFYGVLTAWVWRHRGEGKWLTAWVAFAGWLVFSSDVYFPWYFCWPFMASLCSWDRIHRAMSAACIGIALFLMLIYTRI